MGKIKTSGKQKKSSKSIETVRLKKRAKVEEFSPTVELADENFIGRVILECLKNNDPEGVIEVIEAHLEAINKLRFSREAGIPRSTLYYLSKRKNPTLRTLARTVHEITAICYA
ncbi:MAG: hypothetical protein KR126chlam2_00301 [Chlamydiae bacterium]|nr:hypothetical protein [Chlamydiota bacterium]